MDTGGAEDYDSCWREVSNEGRWRRRFQREPCGDTCWACRETTPQHKEVVGCVVLSNNKE